MTIQKLREKINGNIPVILILFVVGHIFASIWWASNTAAVVKQNCVAIEELEIENTPRAIAIIQTQNKSLKEQIEELRKDIKEEFTLVRSDIKEEFILVRANIKEIK